MAKVPVQKIRVTGLRSHYKILMKELHRRGVMEVSENAAFEEHSTVAAETDRFDAFDLARIDFAIRFLEPHAPKKGKMEKMLTSGKLIMPEQVATDRFKKFAPQSTEVIGACEKLEESNVRIKNELRNLEDKKEDIVQYQSLFIPVGMSLDTEQTVSVIGRVPVAKHKEFVEALARKSNLLGIEVVSEEGARILVRLTMHREVLTEVQGVLQEFNFNEVKLDATYPEFEGQLPKEILAHLDEEIAARNEQITTNEKAVVQLAKNYEDLCIVYDFHAWRKDKNDVQHRVLRTQYVFAFEGWIPQRDFEKLSHWIKQVFVGEVSIDKIDAAEGEKIPALLDNKKGISSFDGMTEMFGSPNDEDIDPTPMIAPFFVFFFGVCLSDTGYGMILALVSAFFMIFGTFSKEARKTLLMVLLCGISATLGGILLGGHFGMTPAEAPGFMTTTNAAGDLMFRGQILDPLAGSGTMTFMIFTFVVGYIQVLCGLGMRIKKGIANRDWGLAFIDGAGWLYTMGMLAIWGLADKIGIDKNLAMNFLLAGVGFLLIGLGRKGWTPLKSKKSVLAKIITVPVNSIKVVLMGALGLYGAMDFVSNILSYSRLMALGLATGIIGAAMNMTAKVLGDMLPGVVGIAVMVAFMLFGHTINFGLSGLGAYVHSMRLQFIEFFGIFYTGGGRRFRPFVRAKKYLLFRS